MLAEHLEDLGVDTETAKAKAASVKTRHRSRTPSTTRGRPIPFMDEMMPRRARTEAAAGRGAVLVATQQTLSPEQSPGELQ